MLYLPLGRDGIGLFVVVVTRAGTVGREGTGLCVVWFGRLVVTAGLVVGTGRCEGTGREVGTGTGRLVVALVVTSTSQNWPSSKKISPLGQDDGKATPPLHQKNA